MSCAGKDGCDHQIGIGIGAGNAVLDASAWAHLIGNAQRDCAVVEAQCGAMDIGLRYVTAVGVGGLGPDGHEVAHGFAQAAERVTEQGETGSPESTLAPALSSRLM